MSLEAELAARQFELDGAGMLGLIKENVKQQKQHLNRRRVLGTAVQSLVGMLHLWIPRMEALGHPKAAQTAREMRDELRHLEKILNG